MNDTFRSLKCLGFPNYAVSLDGIVINAKSGSTIHPDKGNSYRLTDPVAIPITYKRFTIDRLVGNAFYSEPESVWEDSPYADAIREVKEFYSLIPDVEIKDTGYRNSFGDRYFISRYGDVWLEKGPFKQAHGINNWGYVFSSCGTAGTKAVHRLVAKHFVPINMDVVPDGVNISDLVVDHIDCNKQNNRWDNLRWVTLQQNSKFASENKLYSRKISDKTLEEVWKLLADGLTDMEIARITGVNPVTICSIRAKKSPRYLTNEYTWREKSHDGSPRTIPALQKISDEKLEQIFKLLQAGKRDCEIAKEVDVNNGLVVGVRRRICPRYDTPNYTWPDRLRNTDATAKRNAEIIELVREGKMSFKEIADKFNMTVGAAKLVAYKAKKRGEL